MKKSMFVLLAIIILVFLAGCQSQQSATQSTGVASDQELSSDRTIQQEVIVERTNESANLTTAQDTIDQLSLILNANIN